ncbi:hypothetical protein DERF_009989 [Dermatophagoides farinae]|uniref:Uncharacterized protein n=1 Tax=Dermatophagoides farinae TaxID=6954 RepID=A0A922L6C5_DERFA|nr:hypothetical protein DERF_009989 [Dermatophagoides farinae]
MVTIIKSATAMYQIRCVSTAENIITSTNAQRNQCLPPVSICNLHPSEIISGANPSTMYQDVFSLGYHRLPLQYAQYHRLT